MTACAHTHSLLEVFTHWNNERRHPYSKTREEPSGVKQSLHCAKADHKPASREWQSREHERDLTTEEIDHPSTKRTTHHGTDVEKRLVREERDSV